MAEAFYERDGDGFVAAELTRGPWDSGAQHFGPPAALIGREIERLGGGRVGDQGPHAQVGRITYELLRPIPIGRLSVSARLVRPGRSVELIEASLLSGQAEVVRASAWRVRVGDVEFDPPAPSPAPPGPEDAERKPYFPTGEEVGYHSAMDVRFVSGGFMESGPAIVWMRMRRPLVAGEEPTPLQRVLVAADSGNGVSSVLDIRRHLFINIDLSVHLHRMPEGEWVCLDAETRPERHGVGISDSALYDERGLIGRAVQTLLIGER
ncbi:MAG: thioesterase family protein [Solirubrobacterales bacterium]|nr:thioesterase family protein [Solirubrobacterales bacterium]